MSCSSTRPALFYAAAPRLAAALTLAALLTSGACRRGEGPAERSGNAAAHPPPPHALNPLAPDLPGPDGLLYPNFAHAGLPAGAAAPGRALDLAEFGARPGENIAPALKAAVAKAAELGGAVIQFGHGVYFLDEPVLITADNIVLRGMGRGGPGYFSTTIEFRYAPRPGAVEFLFHRDGSAVHPDGFVAVAAHPGLGRAYWDWNLSGEARVNPDTSGQLARIELFLNDKPLAARDTIAEHHFAPQTVLLTEPRALARAGVRHGDLLRLKAVASWNNGQRAEAGLTLRADASLPASARARGEYAIFSFAGQGRSADADFFELSLAAPAARGDTVLRVTPGGDLRPGDLIRVRTESKPAFVPYGVRYFSGYFRVAETGPGVITIDRPVRLDLPLEAGPRIRRHTPIRNAGVENMVIRQTSETWIHGIAITEGWGVWVRNVELEGIGRCPIYIANSARAEARDVLINGAVFSQAGGMSAYAGWFDNAHDSLMENVTAIRLRHAPNLQGQSSGNVIRNCVFENSDLQFHAFYPFENLVEHCRVYATGGTGSYGYGLYTSNPHTQHHQAGPRNVVYGNDIRSPKEPVVFGGAETGWIVAYNRFGVIPHSPWLGREPMPAVRMAEGGSGNLFLRNLFSLAAPDAPILVKGAAGAGSRFSGNVFLNTRVSAVTADREAGWSSVWESNEFAPGPDPARFDAWAPPPSLYLWQKQLVRGAGE